MIPLESKTLPPSLQRRLLASQQQYHASRKKKQRRLWIACYAVVVDVGVRLVHVYRCPVKQTTLCYKTLGRVRSRRVTATYQQQDCALTQLWPPLHHLNVMWSFVPIHNALLHFRSFNLSLSHAIAYHANRLYPSLLSWVQLTRRRHFAHGPRALQKYSLHRSSL
jgi:hypothetical protein